MKLGVHISTAGGVDKAIDRATESGCNTFQIFISNPRGWKPTIISNEQIIIFREKYTQAKIQKAFAHGIYLINLASDNVDNRENSIQSLIEGLKNTDRLGLIGLVTHIGSHHGEGSEIGIKRVVEAIDLIFEHYDGDAWLLLENTAGAGNLVGDVISEIGEIIKRVKTDKVGFCLDTAHAFENGWPIHTEEGLEKILNEIQDHIGLERLKAIHLNDSMTDFNSKRDRHENFGKGFIGEEALVRIITHPKLADKPFAMETPEVKTGDEMRKVIDYIKSLAEEGNSNGRTV